MKKPTEIFKELFEQNGYKNDVDIHEASMFTVPKTKEALKEYSKKVREEIGIPNKIKPRHGSCCCCQDCGHYYDECCCDRNHYIEHVLEKLDQLNKKFGI